MCCLVLVYLGTYSALSMQHLFFAFFVYFTFTWKVYGRCPFLIEHATRNEQV